MLLRIDQPAVPEMPQPDEVIHPENPAEVPEEPVPPGFPGEEEGGFFRKAG